jgi:hypothetical protein
MFYQHTRRRWFHSATLNQRLRAGCVAWTEQQQQPHDDDDVAGPGVAVLCDGPTSADSGLFVNNMDYINLRSFSASDASPSTAAIAKSSPVVCDDVVSGIR